IPYRGRGRCVQRVLARTPCCGTQGALTARRHEPQRANRSEEWRELRWSTSPPDSEYPAIRPGLPQEPPNPPTQSPAGQDLPRDQAPALGFEAAPPTTILQRARRTPPLRPRTPRTRPHPTLR